MKKLFTGLLVFFILAGCRMNTGLFEAKALESDPIIALLSEIPVSAFDDGWLSYADTSALIASRPGAIWPDGIEAFERLKDMFEGSNILQAYMGISAGSSDFYQKFFNYQKLYAISGIDFFKVRQTLEIGIFPKKQIWLMGTFDNAAIQASLLAKGYQLLFDTNAGMEIWCRDGDPASGTKIDLLNRDKGFLFGGNLGQSWPVMIGNSLIGTTPDVNTVNAAANRSEPSLADLNVLRELIDAVPQVDEKDRGTIAQLILVTPSAAGLDLLALPEGFLLTKPGEAKEPVQPADNQPLPAYSVLALSHIYTEDAQWVVIGLAFSGEASATEAAQIIIKRIKKAKLLQTGELLMNHISGMYGTNETSRIAGSKTGNYILILPFRFPAEKEAANTDEKLITSGLPFRFFTNMLMRRDLGWLTIGNWKWE